MRKIPRTIARAPIPLFQHGFGRVFGHRILMIEHHGRKSGQPRYVVLETVRMDPSIPEAVIVSGYGPDSQWFQNVRHDPRVRVWIGGVRGAPARAEILPATAVKEELERYRRKHPRAVRSLGRVLGIPLSTDAPIPDDIGERLPMVLLRPERSRAGTSQREHAQAANA